jgi:predicted nucleic acid-binding protein
VQIAGSRGARAYQTRAASLDTNIIVSALLQTLGPPVQLFLLALGNSIRLCVRGNICAEYEEVIRPPKFHWVRPTETVRACSGPDDDIFLECAQASCARYVVTGNAKDFPPAWLGAAIITPRRFLQIVAGNTETGATP